MHDHATNPNRIRRVYDAIRSIGGDIHAIYLQNYDMTLAKKLVAGVDVWLNTPRRPEEASGTSGMKAARPATGADTAAAAA